MQYGASPQASLSANWGTKELVPHIKISLEESTFLMTGVDSTYIHEKKERNPEASFSSRKAACSKMSDRRGQAWNLLGGIVAGVSDIESYNPQLVVGTGAWRSQKMSLVLPEWSRIGGLDVMIELQSVKFIVE